MNFAPAKDSARDERLAMWITQYGDAVLRMCYVYLRDASLAQDAMQDAYIKAFRKMETLKSSEARAEKSWLMHITLNTCNDYRRTSWFRHVDRSVELDKLPISARDADPQDALLTMDVMRLPSKLKDVVLLYYYQQMTMQEISGILNISISAVAKRLNAVKAKLRATLEGEAFGNE